MWDHGTFGGEEETPIFLSDEIGKGTSFYDYQGISMQMNLKMYWYFLQNAEHHLFRAGQNEYIQWMVVCQTNYILAKFFAEKVPFWANDFVCSSEGEM